MNREQIEAIISAYEELVSRAVRVTQFAPNEAYVDDDENVRVFIDLSNDTVVISWKEYQSDYYGGGCVSTESTKIPVADLFLSDDDLRRRHDMLKSEETERMRKVMEATRIINMQRQEAHDRAEWERLRRKFAG